MSDAWPRGSEWRKWDLHVHSPASHGFKGTWRDFMVQLGRADCDVIGINDYFSVAGYAEVRRRLEQSNIDQPADADYSAALERLRQKTLIPVVECRMNNIVVDRKFQSGSRVNFHLIFSPSLDTIDIETFLRGLNADGSSVGTRYGDSEFLRDNMQVEFMATCRALRENKTFADRVLVWLPYDEYGGADGIDPNSDKFLKLDLLRTADILGSGSNKQSEYFLGKGGKASCEQLERWFGGPKPCIKGSDSHDVSYPIGKLRDKESQPIERYCWIKADPTFDGLRQIINEPECRVYIGRVPPSVERFRTNATKYMREIRVKRVNHNVRGWFDVVLPLNPGMVAIIGNKGSGKSALADILALTANSHCAMEHFSFLKDTRFRERNDALSARFQAQLAWADDRTSISLLSADTNHQQVERAQYVPQAYLETICTENEPGDRSAFQKELRKVIFSHVSESDRLGCATLDDLIDVRTSERNAKLRDLRGELSTLNERIVKGEKWLSSEHLGSLESQLSEKKRELEIIDAAKPKEVTQPQTLSAEEQAANHAVTLKLNEARQSLENTNKSISETAHKYADVKRKLDLLSRLFERIEAIERYVVSQKRASNDEMAELGLSIDEAVDLRVDTTKMKSRVEELQSELKQFSEFLDPSKSHGLAYKKVQLANDLKILQEQASAPAKAYQTYLDDLKAWQDKRNAVEGTPKQEGTRAYYEYLLKAARETWPAQLDEWKRERRQLAENIHHTLTSIRQIFQELFEPVQSFIDSTAADLGGDLFDFATRLEQGAFANNFFEQINQGISGSFYGKEQGESRLKALLASSGFDQVEDALGFAANVEAHLKMDHRANDRPATQPKAQLRKGGELSKLYDYLWGFEYLTPSYALRFQGKDLQQLSPGERGTLLLLFYLLVDKNDVPIIVDQPEENLDNHTVYRLLIPVIKKAKERRQVIMVTHNPNVAVVCDAEQIVHASIDRANDNRVTYSSGAIEDPVMNRRLLDVLEGTMPAFRNRRDKYHDA